MNEMLIMILMVLIITFIALGMHLVLHETGHMIGGFVSGYEFVFIRIGSFTLLNDQGYLRFTRYSVPGTAGQCIMKPPSFNKFKYRLYFAGGILMNGILGIVGLFLCLYCPIEALETLGFELVYMAIIFLFMNGLPLKISGIVNDGYHIFKMNQKDCVKLYNQLMIGVLDIEGKTFNEMADELFVCDLKNTSHFYDAYLILMNAFRCLENNDIDNAVIYLQSMIDDNKCIELFKNAAKIMLILIAFFQGGREAKIDYLIDKKLIKFIKLQKHDLSSLLCYYCLLNQKNDLKAKEIEHQFLIHKDNVLEKGEVPLFMNLYEEIKKHY